MVLVPHKSGTLDPVLVWFLEKVQSWGLNQQFTTGFQKKIFSKISVLILELGLGLVLVLEQKLMIDSKF